MALRKFSKYMKWVSIVVIFSMVLSTGYGAYSFITNYLKDKTIMKIDGEKIDEETFNKELSKIKYGIQTYQANVKEPLEVSDEILEMYTLATILNDTYIDLLIKANKISVSKSVVEAKMAKYEEASGGKQQLAIDLLNRGETINTLQAQIEKEEALNTIKENISNSIEVDEETLKKYYEDNKYLSYDGKSYEEVASQVRQDYNSVEVQGIINKDIMEIAKNAKVEFKVETYKPVYEKLQEMAYEPLEMKTSDLIVGILNTMVQQNISYEEAKTNIVNELEEQLKTWEKIKKKAEDKGLKVDVSKVTKLYSYLMYTQAYINNYIATFNKLSDAELKQIFTLMKPQYDKQATATGSIIQKKYVASKSDEEKAKEKAENLKKEITKDNFGEYAEKYSADPGSKNNGGDLGKQDVSTYVSEFAEAAKAANAGEIVGPIKTSFGYHIIYVVSVDESNPDIRELKHILIPIEISEETKEEQSKKLAEILEKLENGSLTVEKIEKDKTKYENVSVYPFENVVKLQQIANFGYEKDVMEKIFEMEVNTFAQLNLTNSSVIINVTSTTPFEEAKFEDYKNTVRVRMAQLELSQELE